MPTSSKPRRRARTPEQQAAADQARADRLEVLHQQLADGVAAIRDGQAWADWLDRRREVPHLLFGNQLLIVAQQATGAHGRRVPGVGGDGPPGPQGREGAVDPRPGHRRGPRPDVDGALDVDDLGGSTPAPGPGAAGPGARGRGSVVGFRGAPVFDLSQTDGDPIPTPPRPQLLEGQAPPGLWDALTAAITDRGFTVHRSATAADLGGANGVTDYTTRTVTVRADVDDAQAVKTLAHEAGHVLLHNPLASVW